MKKYIQNKNQAKKMKTRKKSKLTLQRSDEELPDAQNY